MRGNVTYPLNTSTRSKRVRETRVLALLDRVGIGALADRFPNELSGVNSNVSHSRGPSPQTRDSFCWTSPFPSLTLIGAISCDQWRIEIATLTRAARSTAINITPDQSEAITLAGRISLLQRGQ